MSSPAPQQSPHERAKAKMDTQNQKLGTDITQLRTALLTQVDNLALSQVCATNYVKDASKSFEQRIQALESTLEAESKRASSHFKSYKATLDELHHANKELGESQSQRAALEKELETAKKQVVNLQAELELAKSRPTDLQEDLKAARQRASTAEDQFKALKTRMSDIMTGFDSSSEQTQPQPASSPAQFPTPQGSVERHDEPQIQDHSLPTSDLDPRTTSNTNGKESDLLHCQKILDELMDQKNWQYNRYFLNAADSLTLASRGAKLGPITLGSMKEKLANGAYTSAASFKADFETMIADCKRLNSPQNVVHIAAEQLSKIFADAFAAQPISSHQSPDNVFSTQRTRNKRKALRMLQMLSDDDEDDLIQEIKNKKRNAGPETEVCAEDDHIPRRRPSAPLEQPANHVQPANPGAGGSLNPTSSPANQPQDNSHAPDQHDASRVVAKITTGKRFGIDTSLLTVGQLVSVTKSPTTVTGNWKSLVPDEYHLTQYAEPQRVGDEISETAFSLGGFSRDMIILRLMPAVEAGKPDFDHFVRHFVEKGRFATVRHSGVGNVEGIYLIHSARTALYPGLFPMLDVGLVPSPKTRILLFLAIVFRVAVDKQRQIRHAWSARLKAIQKHDNASLASMHEALVRNPLPMFGRPGIVSSGERFMTALNNLPYHEEVASPELHAHGQGVLRLSFQTFDLGFRPSVGAVKAPEWVYVLGRFRANHKSRGHAFLVVDIQERDRPLWEIRLGGITQPASKWTIKLLANKFPGSIKEWEGISRGKSYDDCLKGVYVKLERCKLPG